MFYTPEVNVALDWFRWTHTMTEHGWVRSSLPRSGGIADQDARTMLLLDEIRQVANDLLVERLDSGKKSRELASWRAERERSLRNKS